MNLFQVQKKDFFTSERRESLLSWKGYTYLRKYLTRFGAIKPRKYTGTNVKHQKMVRQSIIRARELGLLPYSK